MIVLEGAVAQMLIHRDPAYVQAAGQIAAGLLTNDVQPQSIVSTELR
jgi:hypothetical protein